MSDGIKKVRKSIAQRNKMRTIKTKEASTKQIIPGFPQEEEKHGYFPSFLDSPLQMKNTDKRASRFIIKGVLSVGLFLGAVFLTQTNATLLTKPQEWTSYALTEEFPFARVNQWYQTTFGTPLGFTPKESHVASDALAIPVIGNVTETFQTNGTGIKISPEKVSPVTAWNEGIVIFAGNNRETKKTVIVQHADNSKSTYGYLTSIDVHLYQRVTANQGIGKFDPVQSSETVYFSIERDNEYIDPTQVITVDDIP